MHFQEEQKALEAKLKEFEQGIIEDLAYGSDAEYSEKMDKIEKARHGLRAINGLLWRHEDEVRQISNNNTFKLAVLAKSIANHNDRRAELIKETNELYGVSTQYEKLYTEKVR